MSWQEKIAERMKEVLPDTHKSEMNKFWQAGGKNVDMVNALYNVYAINGFSKANAEAISTQSKIDKIFVDAFMKSVQELATKGEIEYKFYDPATVQKGTEIKKDFLTPQPVKTAENYLKIAATILGGFLILKAMSFLPNKGA